VGMKLFTSSTRAAYLMKLRANEKISWVKKKVWDKYAACAMERQVHIATTL
jgi:hypothetical protein